MDLLTPGVVDQLPGDLPKLVVTTPDAVAEIYLHGAHVTHYQPTGQPPVLFLSKQSRFAPGKAIRGGIPICFPWFGPLEGNDAAPAHGFARTSVWSHVSSTQNVDGSVAVVLQLNGTGGESRFWPHAFRADYTVTVGRTLKLSLKINHTGGEPFLFEEALHSYFVVGDIHRTSVTGLAATEYVDKVRDRRHFTEGDKPIRFIGETDRVYLAATAPCDIHDPALNRVIRVNKNRSDSTVVWNPWVEKSKSLSDLGDDEWPGFVCIESGNIGGAGVILKPGESHEMTVEIETTPR